MTDAVTEATIDLAARTLGGGVVVASDDLFAEKENLLRPGQPVFHPDVYGHKGKVMDGWETRRRREPGHDWVIVRLGAAGVVRRVVVDTSFFTGNYPEECVVEGCATEGYPSPTELSAGEWVELVPRSPLEGDAWNEFVVETERRFTHIRLSIYPDGGVARLRVYGEVVPDPRRVAGLPLDLAAQENGGLAVGCSDRFYSSPHNLNAPGHPAHMGEGWETRRRRGGGNDWVVLRLAAPGVVHQAEIDTTYFVGNAPGACSLRARDATAVGSGDEDAWWDLLPRTRLQPDTRHWLGVAGGRRATHVRVDVFPDGGLARLRLYGELDDLGRARVAVRWFDLLPASQLRAVLHGLGASAEETAILAGSRPVRDRDTLLGVFENVSAEVAARLRATLGLASR